MTLEWPRWIYTVRTKLLFHNSKYSKHKRKSIPAKLFSLPNPSRVNLPRMNPLFILLLLSAHSISVSHAAVIPYAADLDSTAGTFVQSHGLSTEALLTLIGVCVAVFGTALTLVLSWPSLKITWERCISRRSRHPSRSRPVSTGTSAYKRQDHPRILMKHSGFHIPPCPKAWKHCYPCLPR